jgi:RNA polymerase sigma factor (sigma-70 family)
VPPDFGRFAAAAVMNHKLLRPYRRGGRLIHTLLIHHNGRLLPLIGRKGWFGAAYPGRWDWPASCFLDVRIAGKARNRADVTCTQAAAKEAEETLDCLSTHQNPPRQKKALRECPACFYETPVLGFFWLWLVAALKPEEAPRPYYYSNIFWHKRRASRVSLNEVIDQERVADSKRRDANPPPPARTVLLEPEEELALARRGKAGDIDARNQVIAAHIPLVKRKTKGMAELHDIRQACTERLIKVFAAFDPELGVRFGAFAAEAIDWAIQDYLKERRTQVPVERSINIPTKDDDHEGAVEMSSELYEARRRLVAERLHCLNGRERRIVEGRLALNGLNKAATLDELADQFDISRGQVQQIEHRAAIKLQRSVA